MVVNYIDKMAQYDGKFKDVYCRLANIIPLPEQKGKNGKYLYTNGISLIWKDVSGFGTVDFTPAPNSGNAVSSGGVFNVISAIQADKQNNLISGVNLKTINQQSLLGSGNIEVIGGGGSIEIDNNPTPNSSNAISSGGVFAALATKANAANLLTLGSTASDAYRGDRGSLAFNHTLLTSNPHSVTKSQVGLGNADDTADVNKPISTLQAQALAGKAPLVHVHAASDITESTTKRFITDTERALWNGKQPTLVSGTSIKTINGVSILGSGDYVISSGGTVTVDSTVVSGSTNPVSGNGVFTTLSTKADLSGGKVLDSQLPSAFFAGFTGDGLSSGTSFKLDTDITPIANSLKPITSGAVYAAIQALPAASPTLNNLSISSLRGTTAPDPAKIYYTTDINKEGLWFYDSGDTTTVDDTALTVVAGSKRFKRVTVDTVCLFWFGVVDGITSEQTTLIQSAIDVCAANNKILWIPKGTFVTKKLYIPSNSIIRGEGTLKMDPTTVINEHMFQIGNSPTSGGKTNIRIEGITLDMNGANTPGSAASGITAIKVWSSSNIYLQRLTILNNNYLGVVFTNSNGCWIKDCIITNTDASIITFGGNTNINILNNRIINGTSEGISLYGDVSGSTNIFDDKITVTGNYISNKTLSAGINIRNQTNTVIQGNTVIGCRKGIATESLSGTLNQYINIIGNVITSSIGDGIGGTLQHSSISNNIITDAGSNGIWLGSYTDMCLYNTISNNKVLNPSLLTANQDGIRLTHSKFTLVQGNYTIDTRTTTLMRIGIHTSGSDCDSNKYISNVSSGKLLDDFFEEVSVANSYYTHNSGSISSSASTGLKIIYGEKYYSGTGYQRTVSATSLTLPSRGDYYEFTATSAQTLSTITAPDNYLGREVKIKFLTSNITLTGAGNLRIFSSPYTPQVGELIRLTFDGTNWLTPSSTLT